MEQYENKNDIFVLLFGGSKFMGLNFIEEITKKNTTKNIYLFIINRGNSYWNGKFYEYITPHKDWIFHYKADRRDKHEFHQVLKNLFDEAQSLISKKSNNFQKKFIFDYIIDFTVFKKKDVYYLFDFLAFYDKDSFEKYIIISTDSTYNASELAFERNNEYFINKYFSDYVKYIYIFFNYSFFIQISLTFLCFSS